MHERLTDDAGKALTFAQEEARGLRHNWVGTEHLLLSLLRHQDAFAARALASLGVTLDAAQKQVDALIGDRYKSESGDRKNQAARRLREDWRNRSREATCAPRYVSPV